MSAAGWAAAVMAVGTGVATVGTEGTGVGRTLGADEARGDAAGVRDGVGVGAGELVGTMNPPGVPTETGAAALPSS